MADKKKNKLCNLIVKEVSLVDNPANAGATVEIFKFEKGAFAEVEEENRVQRAAWKALDPMYAMTYTLEEAFVKVLTDDSIKDKKKAMKECIKEFASSYSKKIDDVDIEKKISDLKNEIYKQEADKMNEKEVQAAIEKAVKEAIEKKDSEIASLKAMAGMTDAEKAYLEKLPEDKKEDFLKMDSAKRKDVIEKSQKSDEVLEYEGSVIRKSEVGDSQFTIYKSMVSKLEKAEKDAAIEKALREEAEFVKKAETEYPNLPGKPEEKGKVLKAISKMASEDSKYIMETLSKANAILKSAFTEIGASGEAESKEALEKLNKMASDVASKEGITFQKAFDKVLNTPEGQQLYEEEKRERQSRAPKVLVED